MKHTEGKLKVLKGDEQLYLVPENGTGDTIAKLSLPKDMLIKMANAQRLADCWNACEGIETEDLADPPLKFTIANLGCHVEQLQSRLAHSEKVKGELLEACKEILYAEQPDFGLVDKAIKAAEEEGS